MPGTAETTREITIAKTLRPTTNIRALMSIVEEEWHNHAKETRIEGWNRRKALYSTRGTEISRLARVEYAPTALFHPTFFAGFVGWNEAASRNSTRVLGSERKPNPVQPEPKGLDLSFVISRYARNDGPFEVKSFLFRKMATHLQRFRVFE
uniref:Uncharacterized protein n=1 Tax=Candidatus Kentrum sp. LFY TaxID=2126342 RepID=A0A450V3E3_9GAMM|nr:MAG: hypothetical protein BECKLFY1418B_GA0070995_11422 [Candidatus Kentron sp. LFY]